MELNDLMRLAGIEPPGIREQVYAKLQECADKLNYTDDLPVVVFDLKGRTAGQAILNRNKIRLNVELLHTHVDRMLNQTLPHEFAHIVAYKEHGDNGHGYYWKWTMIRLGLVPDRTHDMPVTAARHTKKYTYYCKCGPQQIGSTRHKRVLQGKSRYGCKVCGATLLREPY
jgi:SprT protein